MAEPSMPLGKIARFFFDLVILLGAISCILYWAGIKPRDLLMTPSVPHVTWLIVGLFLLAVSIVASWHRIFTQGKQIEALAAERDDALTTASRLSKEIEYRNTLPRWSGYESEAVWMASIQNQNRLIDLGRSVDGLLVPVQVEALSLAKELRNFGDSLPPYPTIPAQRHDEPNGDYMVRHHTLITEARPQWERQLYHGYANRDFGRKVAAIFHRAGEEYDLEYPHDMLSRSAGAGIGPSLTPYGIPKLAQEMEMIAMWINRKPGNEENLFP